MKLKPIIRLPLEPIWIYDVDASELPIPTVNINFVKNFQSLFLRSSGSYEKRFNHGKIL